MKKETSNEKPSKPRSERQYSSAPAFELQPIWNNLVARSLHKNQQEIPAILQPVVSNFSSNLLQLIAEDQKLEQIFKHLVPC